MAAFPQAPTSYCFLFAAAVCILQQLDRPARSFNVLQPFRSSIQSTEEQYDRLPKQSVFLLSSRNLAFFKQNTVHFLQDGQNQRSAENRISPNRHQNEQRSYWLKDKSFCLSIVYAFCSPTQLKFIHTGLNTILHKESTRRGESTGFRRPQIVDQFTWISEYQVSYLEGFNGEYLSVSSRCVFSWLLSKWAVRFYASNRRRSSHCQALFVSRTYYD